MKRQMHMQKSDKGIIKLTNLVKFAKKLEYYIVNNPDGVELPGRLGILRIVGYIPTQPLLNRYASRIHKRKIYYTNEETDGFSYKIMWQKHRKGLRGFRCFKYSSKMQFKPGVRLRKAIRAKTLEDPYFYNRRQ